MPALIDGRGRTRTIGWFAAEVGRLAGGLRRAGLAPGDRVAFSIRPSLDGVAAALAVVAAGGTVAFADPGMGAELFAARMAMAAPAMTMVESVLHAAAAWPPLRAAAAARGLRLPDWGAVAPVHLYAGPRLPGLPPGARPLRSLAGRDRLVPGEPDPGQPAVIVFTSGTTAAPKAVVHTRGTLAAGAARLGAVCPHGPGDVVHTDQLMLGLPALAAGATWSLPPRRCPPARLARDLAARGATHTFLVPVELARLLDAVDRLPAGLRAVLLGAAPVPPPVLRRALAAAAPGTSVVSVYAMTEILPVAVVDARAKLAWVDAGGLGDLVGAPVDGVTVRLDPGGQLHLGGPHLAAYLGRPPDTEVEAAAELATGDLARLDGDGRLVLMGRAKDMLIRGRFNLYPGLYEPAVANLPGVAEAAFVGLPDRATGDEEVVLALVPAPGADPARLPERVRASLAGLIDAHALPDRVVTVAALPTAGRSRKLDRAALASLVGGP